MKRSLPVTWKVQVLMRTQPIALQWYAGIVRNLVSSFNLSLNRDKRR